MTLGCFGRDANAQYRISGTITDSAGAPLLGVEVVLFAADAPAYRFRTLEDGRFSLVGDRSPEARLLARRLGYSPRTFPLTFPADSGRSFTIALAAAPVLLSDVDIDGTRSGELGGWLKDFYERRRSNSFGHYFARDNIVRREPHHMSEMLRSLPGVTLLASRRFGYVVRFRGCRQAPLVWLDGMRLPGAELDDVVKPSDIAAMEVYFSPAGVPGQFLDRSNGGCGTILVWTRHQ
jgi:hypothetical protein